MIFAECEPEIHQLPLRSDQTQGSQDRVEKFGLPNRLGEALLHAEFAAALRIRQKAVWRKAAR